MNKPSDAAMQLARFLYVHTSQWLPVGLGKQRTAFKFANNQTDEIMAECAEAIDAHTAAALAEHQKVIEEAERALRSLAVIAEAYRKSNLDEARPEWGDDNKCAKDIILFTGRGGATLMTLENCLVASQALASIAALKTNEKP